MESGVLWQQEVAMDPYNGRAVHELKTALKTLFILIMMAALAVVSIGVILGSFMIGPVDFVEFGPLHAQGCRLFFGWILLIVFVLMVPVRYPPAFFQDYQKTRVLVGFIILVIFIVDLDNWITSLSGA